MTCSARPRVTSPGSIVRSAAPTTASLGGARAAIALSATLAATALAACFPSFATSTSGAGAAGTGASTSLSSGDGVGVVASSGTGVGGGGSDCNLATPSWAPVDLGESGGQNPADPDAEAVRSIAASGPYVYFTFAGDPALRFVTNDGGGLLGSVALPGGAASAELVARGTHLFVLAWSTETIDLYDVADPTHLGGSLDPWPTPTLSCTDPAAGGFDRPSLAVDDQGRAYVAVSAEGANASCNGSALGSSPKRVVVLRVANGQTTQIDVIHPANAGPLGQPVLDANAFGVDVAAVLEDTPPTVAAYDLLPWPSALQILSSPGGPAPTPLPTDRLMPIRLEQLFLLGGTYRQSIGITGSGSLALVPATTQGAADQRRIRSVDAANATIAFGGRATQDPLAMRNLTPTAIPNGSVQCAGTTPTCAYVAAVSYHAHASPPAGLPVVHTFDSPSAVVTSVAVDPCGQVYAAGAYEGTLVDVAGGSTISGDGMRRHGFMVKLAPPP
jgi:hypothetical protein